MNFFEGIELSFPTDDKDLNTWADHCEFFCLASENKSRTIENLKEQLIEQHQGDYRKARKSISLSGSQPGKFIITSMEIEEDLESALLSITEEEIDFEDVSSTQKSNDSQLEDEINSEFLFLFHFLQSRANLFKDAYPYKIEITSNRISVNHKRDLTNKHKLYIAFLLSSILRLFKEGVRNTLGHLFEDFTETPFKKLTPNNSRIEFFGAGKKHVDTPFFSGSFDKKVEKLAKTLQTDTTTEFKENKHDYSHNGDGGLDWVAWLPFQDVKSKFPVFFGQCACGNDWIDKEWDAHDDKWGNFIQLQNSYLLFHFVGKSIRKHDGNWFKPGKIYNIILVDRLRLLTVLNTADFTKAANIYKELIKQAFALKMSDSD